MQGGRAEHAAPSVAVVHIALAEFGLEPFRRFIASYRANPPGLTHDLIIVFKGFAAERDAAAHRELLADLPYRPLHVGDGGFDIGSYLRAADEFDADAYCFLNSRSVILAAGWLEAMHRHVVRPGVGVVGATASFESLYTDFLQARRLAPARPRGWRQRVRSSILNAVRHLYYFPPYPNPHIRTNAVMIRQEVLQRVRHWPFHGKLDTARFENGRGSLSRQLTGMGLELLVVGRDGAAYPSAAWPRSGTFWQACQENLLVADNQTQRYALAEPAERERLSRLAWGLEDDASPGGTAGA